ncbi:MAG: hypothetical protein ACLFVU_05910 [Phycisphaerae bacterium]
MILKWLPWRLIAKHLARAHGFIDPVNILARMEALAQPSEVGAPIELIRAGMVLHARGLINRNVIQQNLDWIWPFWVARQFDPTDSSFLPRSFSITHVNLTHRNWTAVGLPDCRALPIVDPRGLLTPFFDGWSIDAWLLTDDGRTLLPSRRDHCRQKLCWDEDDLWIETQTKHGDMSLFSDIRVVTRDRRPVLQASYRAQADSDGHLVLALRPFNPEGVSFIEAIELEDSRRSWRVEDEHTVTLSRSPDKHKLSDYSHGDVFLGLSRREETDHVSCNVGLASAAAMYRLQGGETEVDLSIDLMQDRKSTPVLPVGHAGQWPRILADTMEISIPDEKMAFLTDAAIRSMVLMSPLEVYPGPYTYRRFWFRDAALILNAMLCAGLVKRSERTLKEFLPRQRLSGYFRSQSGEWDSNGQVLWIYKRFCELCGYRPDNSWRRPVERAARWIGRKRVSTKSKHLHAGLLPAGFSAEHFGNNDYYYWDDFWSVAGLRAAAWLSDRWARSEAAEEFRAEADDLSECIESSLERSRRNRTMRSIPASPYRRMDSGAVGSLVASYPLGLLKPDDPRLLGTANFLYTHCRVRDAFFLDMVHSGLNAYLTLHLAQAYLRAGDKRYFGLVQAVADIASPTGQWPEAVHPNTSGGCMGDGQHIWAAAEWVMMMRNMFVREEGEMLILASGVPNRWITSGRTIRLGPTLTPWGPITVRVDPADGGTRVSWDAAWRGDPPEVQVRLPGKPVRKAQQGRSEVFVPDDAKQEVGS